MVDVQALSSSAASHKILLGQMCVLRGISLGHAPTHEVVNVSDGFNFANLTQLLGRGSGIGFHGPIKILMRRDDFENVQLLPEFQLEALRANMAGLDFRDCDALAHPKFKGLLEMCRPFNKKAVRPEFPVT